MGEDRSKEDPLYAATLRSTEPPPDSTSLNVIFEQHQRRILGAAYRITGNVSDAEDVLQTVFLRLARRDGGPGPSETLGPYLHRAAVNAALDMIRSRRRARAVPLDDGENDRHQDPSPGPEQRRTSQEVLELVRSALKNISQRAAEMFTLRYLEGYTNKDIARMMSTSQTAVGVTLHRARGQLRESLGSLLGEL